MFGLFIKKNRIKEVKEETKRGFESVKKDLLSITGWIKHLDHENTSSKKEIDEIKRVLSTTNNELENVKNILSMITNFNLNNLSKQPVQTKKRVLDKQTAVYDVQTAVQTAVQTPKMANFSITERAILFILLNTDMKLSYEDLASMLNKEKSTVRGQINAIKAKSESLIQEKIEKNGKKRIYISEEMKHKLIKKEKVKVRHIKDQKSEEKNK